MVEASSPTAGRVARFLPDFRDVLAFAGLSLLTAGIWMIYPPVALIVVGLILLIVAFFGVPKWAS